MQDWGLEFLQKCLSKYVLQYSNETVENKKY